MVSIPDIWYLIFIFQLLLYVTLDGADLGIGIITLWQRTEKNRGIMMNSIGPVWDANETWLVVAGTTLFGAFPRAYAAVLPPLTFPILLMLLGLMTRALSFEFHRHGMNKRLWSTVFSVASLLAVLGQAFFVGGLIGGAVSGGSLFSLLSLVLVAGIISGYVLLGYAYLIRHTKNNMNVNSHRSLRIAALVSAAFVIVGFAVLARSVPGATDHWSALSPFIVLLVLTVISYVMVYVSANNPRALRSPYWWGVGAIVGVCGFAVLSLYPWIAPGSITITDAAAGTSTLIFMLWGMLPLIPIVLFYNIYMHRIFDGKVDPDELYE